MSKFGLTERYSKFGLAGKYSGSGDVSSFTAAADQQAYQSALAKKKAGLPMSPAEEQALTAMDAQGKAVSLVGRALQPFQAPGDLTRGLIQDAKTLVTTGQYSNAGGNAGMNQAMGHLTYGATERLPSQAGARVSGVSGAQLLKGTRWENNPKAAMWTEILADPTIALTGLGAIGKAATMTAKLAGLEKLATTAAGRATISSALSKVGSVSGTALHLGDELTGLPTVIRGASAPLPKIGGLVARIPGMAGLGADAARGGVAGAIVGGGGRLADKVLPAPMQKVLGVKTVGDAFYTPDMKAATYTPEQLAAQHFRDTQRVASGDLSSGIATATIADAKPMTALTKGLKTADAAEVNRLLGVFTSTTDPAIAAEAVRKVTVIGTRLGRDLETPFVDAVKGADRFSQVTIGNNLRAQGLPVILDPAVTKAIQEAQSGADLVAQVGKYATEGGRPRGILMTQYTGRGDPSRVIADLNAKPATPASVTLDAPKITQTLDDAAKTVEVPVAPMRPTGTPAAGAAPVNTAETAAKVTGAVPTVDPVAAALPPTVRSPDAVLKDIFGEKAAPDLARAPDPVNVAPVRAAEAAPTPVPEPAPGAAPVADPAVNSAADLGRLGGQMSDGFSGSMYDMLHGKYLAGDTTELGKPSNILIGAQRLKANGVDLTREQFPDFAGQFSKKLTETSGAADQQAQLQQFLKDYTPPASVSDAATVAPSQKSGLPSQNAASDWVLLDEKTKQPVAMPENAGLPPKPSGDVVGTTKDGRQVAFVASPWEVDTRRGDLTMHISAMVDDKFAGVLTIKKFGKETGFEPFSVSLLDPYKRQGIGTGIYDYAFKHLGLPESQNYYGHLIDDGPAFRAKYDMQAPSTLRPAPTASLTDAAPATKPTSAVLSDLFAATPPTASKTPDAVLREVLAPTPPAAYIGKGPQADLKSVGLLAPPREYPMVKDVPSAFRTVPTDSRGLNWNFATPAERNEVQAALNSGTWHSTAADGSRVQQTETVALVRGENGQWRPNRPVVDVPLDHPVLGRYFSNDAIEQSRMPGQSGYGEAQQLTKQEVPSWYDPKSKKPLAVQASERVAAFNEKKAAQYANDYTGQLMGMARDGQLDDWAGGYALGWAGKPSTTALTIDTAANEYAARVTALRGGPPLPAEVFQYQQRLRRYWEAQRLAGLKGADVTSHLQDFFKANPEATLYEATLSAAKQFAVGGKGAKFMTQILRNEESGFMRQLSSLEKKEFAQYLMGRDVLGSGKGAGMLTNRLLRNPLEVSGKFRQVFPEEENAMKILVDQARTRTAAIVQADNLRAYHDYLTQSGQHLTAQQLSTLRSRPIGQLTAEERALRERIGAANDSTGVPAGWKILDKGKGKFAKGDAVPWWAHADLFAADATGGVTGARILERGGVDPWNRLWAAQNAQMLSGVSSIINDQMGMFQQMILWGVGPEEIVNGMIRRAAASTNPEGRAMLAAMRENGIASAKLESNLGMERGALEGLARRLDGDNEMSALQRVGDAIVRFREFGTGVDRAALTNTAAKVAADVTHTGGAYLFQVRSAMADLQREALYFHYASTGMSSSRAAAAANDVLMDMRLAPAYSRVVSKFWPFFRWTAMSAPRGVLTLFRRPGLSYSYQSISRLSDTATATDDKNPLRRTLARDGGYINLGVDERGGSRLYLDTRNWDVEGTIPQLLDWSGTKVGSIGLPWYANLVAGVGWGLDRSGNGVYSSILGGSAGGWQQAYQADPKQASILAAKYVWNTFNPSYAPGSSRAVALAASIVETSKLPDDGSRDIQIAKTLMGTGWGQAAVRYMQQGAVGLAASVPLTGNRGSPYSGASPSLAGAALNFVIPIRRVNPNQATQGDAQQKLMVGQLELQNYISAQKKKLGGMAANPGTTPAQIRAVEAETERGAGQRGAALERLDHQTR